MKVKSTPADFVVQEVSSLSLRSSPTDYAVFRLTKSSWDTFDLIDLLARRFRVRPADISVGGLKDRPGSTDPLISVRGLHDAPRSFSEKNYAVVFTGWTDGPLSARDVSGNRFAITLRDMSAPERDAVRVNAPTVARDGVPNYYDEQRFGSARHGEGFMGKEIFLGNREKALRLWFTPSKHDDQKTRKMKKCVIENWGRWSRCAGMGFGEYGRVLAYLAENHRAFHQALERIDRRFLVFALNAYQSFLFNEILGRWLAARAAPVGFTLLPLRYAMGTFQLYGALPAGAAAAMVDVTLPVPGHDTRCDDPVIRGILDEVLGQEGIALSDLRVRQMHRIRVGGVERAAVVVPGDLVLEDPQPDELYPGRWKALLRFFLPRGSYATIVVKRLTLPPGR
ncbi:MAG TPA: tRNA pseudouridine(13) synthase TruD [Spirochaetia bacterium]